HESASPYDRYRPAAKALALAREPVRVRRLPCSPEHPDSPFPIACDRPLVCPIRLSRWPFRQYLAEGTPPVAEFGVWILHWGSATVADYPAPSQKPYAGRLLFCKPFQ